MEYPEPDLQRRDGSKTLIPSAQWAWAYCPSGWPGTPNPNYICLNGQTFNPNLLYEVVYTAANPLVLGVGFAAFRDLGSFLRYGTTAPGGGSNPIAGSITSADDRRRIAVRRVHPRPDLLWLQRGRRRPHRLRRRLAADRRAHDGDEHPLGRSPTTSCTSTWAATKRRCGGQTIRTWPATFRPMACFTGAAATNTCPQILETFGSAEMYSEKMLGEPVRLHLRRRHSVAFERLPVLLARRDAWRRRGELHLVSPRLDHAADGSDLADPIRFRRPTPTTRCRPPSSTCC